MLSSDIILVGAIGTNGVTCIWHMVETVFVAFASMQLFDLLFVYFFHAFYTEIQLLKTHNRGAFVGRVWNLLKILNVLIYLTLRSRDCESVNIDLYCM